MNFGSIIHYDHSLPNANSVRHPISIQGSITLYSIFTEILIEGYLDDENDSFQKLCRGKSSGIDDGNAIFYRSQGIRTNPQNINEKQDCTLFSFIPKNINSKKAFLDAINVVEKLIPFTPSSLLIPDNALKCFVSIRGIGTDKIDSTVHLFNCKNYFAYQINKDLLNYAAKRTRILKSPIEKLTFAMTGEFLSYPINNSDEENESKETRIAFPQANPKCNSVFSDDRFYHSHVILTSTYQISSKYGNMIELPWTRLGISAEFSSDDYIAHAANSISRELLSIKKSGTCFIFTLPTSKIVVNGTVPSLQGMTTMSFSEAGLYRQQERRPLGELMDLYAMNYIKNASIVRPLPFKSFEFQGNRICDDVNPCYIYQKKKEISEEIESLKKQISEKKAHRDELKLKINYENKSMILGMITSLKNQIDELYNRLNPLIEESKQLIEKAKANPRLKDLDQLEQTHIRYFGPACICIDTYNSNPNEIKTKALSLISRLYRNVLVEEISSFQITIKHRRYSSLSKEQFTSIVESVTNQFGAVITRKSKYNDINSNLVKGTISINLLSCEFTLPIAGMIKQAFLENNQNKILSIPRTIVDPYLINDKKIVAVLKDWFKMKRLDIKKNGIQWFGASTIVEKALQQLNQDPPNIPYKEYRIPSNVNLLIVDRRLCNKRSEKWYLNKRSRSLFVPTNVPEQTINNFIEKLLPGKNGQIDIEEENNEIEKILGDYMFCEEEAELSRNFINIFLEDGRIAQRNYCVSCVHDMFAYNLRKMFDSSQNEILMDEVINDDEFLSPIQLMSVETNKGDKNDVFPLIPFGQMFWNFVNEPKISNEARAWVTIVAIKAIRKSQYFTFCPDHPAILIPKPSKGKSCKCLLPDCRYFLCGDCGNWHKPDKCEVKTYIPPGFRVCPYCHEAVEKSMACNYLACRCGKAFCYYCGLGLSEGKHSVDEHGSCFNHPPDYRKYCLHENISDEELNAFYKKYPKWRPGIPK